MRPIAKGRSNQVNVTGDNYGPVFLSSRPDAALNVHQLPPPPHDFVGREDERRTVAEAILDPSSMGRLIICFYGPPGVGKSALALKIAYEHQHLFPDAQIHVEVDGSARQVGSREVLAATLNSIHLDDYSGWDPPALRAAYRETLFNRDSLLLIENVRSVAQVSDLLPNSSRSLVLTTSQPPLATLAGATFIRVDVLPRQEAQELFTTVSGRRDDPIAVDHIIEACGGLPVALRICAAICRKRPYYTLAEMANDLNDEADRLKQLRVDELDLAATFAVSYRSLSEEAQWLFRRLSLLDFWPATRNDLQDLSKEAIPSKVIMELVDAQIMETAEGNVFSLHSLLRLFSMECAVQEDDQGELERARRDYRGKAALRFAHAYLEQTKRTIWSLSEPRFASRDAAEDSRTFDQLYVDQRLTDAMSGHSNPASTVLRDTKRLLVTGGPGSGKTSLAYKATTSRWLAEHTFIFPARHYHRQVSLEGLLSAYLSSQQAGIRINAPMLETLLQEGGGVIFDSLDELPPTQRHQFVHDIVEFGRRYPSAPMMITSRPDSSLVLQLDGNFALYDLDALTDDGVRSLVTLQAAFLRPDWNEQSFTLSAKILEVINSRATPSFRNPLLVSWLGYVGVNHGRLPGDELDLYEQVFQMRLGRRDLDRRIQRSLDLRLQELSDAVSYLAFWFKSDADRLNGVPADELLDALQDYFVGRSHERPRLAAEELLHYVTGQSEGVVRSQDGRLFLVQDSFGEFLAAKWLSNLDSDLDWAQMLWRTYLQGHFDAGWRLALDLRMRSIRYASQLRNLLDTIKDAQPSPIAEDSPQVAAALSWVERIESGLADGAVGGD